MGKGISRAGRLVTTGVLALGSAGALTGAFLAAGVDTASASSASLTYTCNLIGKTFPVTVTYTATPPASVAPGGAVSLSGFQASATLPASTVTLIVNFAHVSSIGGTITTLDLGVSGGTPATVNAAATPISFNVPVKVNTPATLTVPSSPTTVSGIKAGSKGTLVLTPGEIAISAKVSGVSVTVGCTAPSSVPSTDTFSIPIGAASGGTGTTPATVPSSHTGEPWAGWPYWLLVSLFGLAGFGILGRAARLRRQKA